MLKKGPNRCFMPRKRSRRPKFQEKLARNRINKLFLLFDSKNFNVQINPKKCINFAKLIGKRYNQRLPSSYRIKFCRSCNIKFKSDNSRFRISKKGWRSISCLECGAIYRSKI